MIKKFFHRLHPLILIGVVVAIAVIATVGYFWPQGTPGNQGATIENTLIPNLTTTTTSDATTASAASMSAFAREYFTPGEPLRWLQIKAEKNQVVPHDVLAFTLKGKKVTELKKGQEYFLAATAAYRHFAPRSIHEAARLQLPNVPLTPVDDEGAFIIPADTWVVPANIPHQVTYKVNFSDPRFEFTPAPAGAEVNEVFTLWIVNN